MAFNLEELRERARAALGVFADVAAKGQISVVTPPAPAGGEIASHAAAKAAVAIALAASALVLAPAAHAQADQAAVQGPAVASLVSEVKPVKVVLNGVQRDYVSNADANQLAQEVNNHLNLKSGWAGLGSTIHSVYGWDVDKLRACFPDVAKDDLKGLVQKAGFEMKEAEAWAQKRMDQGGIHFPREVSRYYKSSAAECRSGFVNPEAQKMEVSLLRAVFGSSFQFKLDIDKVSAIHVKSPDIVGSEAIKEKVRNIIEQDGGNFLGSNGNVNIFYVDSDSMTAEAHLMRGDGRVVLISRGMVDKLSALIGGSRSREAALSLLFSHEMAHAGQQPDLAFVIRSESIAAEQTLHSENFADSVSALEMLDQGFSVGEVLTTHVANDLIDAENMIGSKNLVSSSYASNNRTMIRILSQGKTPGEIIADLNSLKSASYSELQRISKEADDLLFKPAQEFAAPSDQTPEEFAADALEIDFEMPVDNL